MKRLILIFILGGLKFHKACWIANKMVAFINLMILIARNFNKLLFLSFLCRIFARFE